VLDVVVLFIHLSLGFGEKAHGLVLLVGLNGGGRDLVTSLTVHSLHASFTGVGSGGLLLLHGGLHFLVCSDILSSFNFGALLNAFDVTSGNEGSVGFLSGLGVLAQGSKVVHRDDNWRGIRSASVLLA